MQRKITVRVLMAMMAVALSQGLSGQAYAREPITPVLGAVSGETRDADGQSELTPQDLERWLDGFMAYALKRDDVAGAVVIVVKDGKPFLEKGYGYADVARKAPVLPETTLFRTGSTGKLFTWTAVMQLVEQHKIDLDRDVNDYLDFKIPVAFGRPITMRQLMQHTAGFEEHAKFLFVDDLNYLLPLERYVKENIPNRIFPPGEVPAYSNYGATLAGYIVQRISGEPFEQYVERHIFAPLNMAHSTLRQPLPPELSNDMSKGYHLASEPPQPYEIGNVRAAGVAANSGADMGRFMIAHLSEGQFGNSQILQPETVDLMHRQSFQAIPSLPGAALGFYREDRNGYVVIAHEGDTNFFHSNLELVLDQHLGFFVSVNSLGTDGAGGKIRNAVFNEFMNRYFPAAPARSEQTAATAKADGALLAGNYRLTRRAEHTLFDVVYVIGQNAISEAPDGTLTVGGITDLAGALIHWREIAPFVWQDTNSRRRMAARVDNGAVKAVWTDETVPFFVLQRVPLTHDKSWLLPLLGFSAIVLLYVALAWPLSFWIRRHYGQRLALSGRRALLYRGVRVSALLNVICMGGMIGAIFWTISQSTALDGTHDWVFRLFQLCGVLGLAGVALGPWNVMQVFGESLSSWWTRISAIVVAFALICASYLEFALHLITLRMSY